MEWRKGGKDGEIARLDVMRKERGYGAAYGADKNGDWEYASYSPDGKLITDAAASLACAKCHLKAGAGRTSSTSAGSRRRNDSRLAGLSGMLGSPSADTLQDPPQVVGERLLLVPLLRIAERHLVEPHAVDHVRAIADAGARRPPLRC